MSFLSVLKHLIKHARIQKIPSGGGGGGGGHDKVISQRAVPILL